MHQSSIKRSRGFSDENQQLALPLLLRPKQTPIRTDLRRRPIIETTLLSNGAHARTGVHIEPRNRRILPSDNDDPILAAAHNPPHVPDPGPSEPASTSPQTDRLRASRLLIQQKKAQRTGESGTGRRRRGRAGQRRRRQRPPRDLPHVRAAQDLTESGPERADGPVEPEPTVVGHVAKGARPVPPGVESVRRQHSSNSDGYAEHSHRQRLFVRLDAGAVRAFSVGHPDGRQREADLLALGASVVPVAAAAQEEASTSGLGGPRHPLIFSIVII